MRRDQDQLKRRNRFIIGGAAVAGVALCAGVGLSAASGGGFGDVIAQVAGITPANATQGRGLTAFNSDDELRTFLRRHQESARRRATVYDAESSSVPMPAPPMAAQSAAPAAGAMSADNAVAPTASGITNNQEQGVDEGDIVKTYRDMLVILRRGRLFTVSTADGGLRPVASINAFPPGVSGSGDWYDEMLVSGDRVVVIGYSYARGGTEVNRFRISPDGQLRFDDAYHLKSNDYYSSRNYASRLIGNRLVYYTPLYLGGGSGDPLDALPAVRRWQGDARGAFHRIADARHVYIAPGLKNDPDADLSAMHSVVSCDLTAPELDCDATAVIGPESRTFYVSSSGVYLWINGENQDPKANAPGAYLYRLPFDEGAKPSAIAARGAPVDQFSFREDPDAHRIDVLLRSQGGGDAMWRPEFSEGHIALLQVPFDALDDGSEEAPARLYRDLPAPRGENGDFQNRFVGNYILYGSGSSVTAADVRGGPVQELALGHDVERIEPLGDDAVAVGGSGDELGFSEVVLSGDRPAVGSRYVLPAAGQGESRSHAFFYSPDAGAEASGTLGLPVAKPAAAEYQRFFGSAAGMLFLRRDDHRFSPAGLIDASMTGVADDGCVASCVDWYGNARPIFWNGRVFALLGYELVEGRMSGGRVSEVRRVSYAPTFAMRGGKPTDDVSYE